MLSLSTGVIGLIILALDVYAILNILAGGGSPGRKALWVLLILLLPVLGLLIWFVAGPDDGAVRRLNH